MMMRAMAKRKQYGEPNTNVQVFIAMSILLLSSISFADISPFERKTHEWESYKDYIIRFPSLQCSEYNYNNGPLTQDLRIFNMPPDAVLLDNSYGEIIQNGASISREYKPDIQKNSYTSDSVTYDLPKSNNGSDECFGIFYLSFASAVSLTTSTTIYETQVNITNQTDNITTTTTTIMTSQNEKSIIDQVIDFLKRIFGWK